jgi:membrane protease YdiL (CAAX protease family)
LRRTAEFPVTGDNVRLCQTSAKGAIKPAVGFITLLVCFWFIAQRFNVTIRFYTGVSVGLLLAPYWAFGFGLDRWLRARLRSTAALILSPLLLMLAYLVFALPGGQFHWSMFVGMTAIVCAIVLLLLSAEPDTPGWRDWVVLLILGISVDLHLFDQAWPVAGLSGMPKLLFVDAGLYGYLVIRPLHEVGFDFRVRLSDVAIGMREFLYYAPIALLLGFALDFLHFHRTAGDPLAFAAGWLFTLFFVAMPEELFFRGLMLNMLERRVGPNRALAITSLLFGLAHFNKRTAYFNWRYVILAAVAGIFYGRAWIARRRLIASSITHATVDTVWSMWLR